MSGGPTRAVPSMSRAGASAGSAWSMTSAEAQTCGGGCTSEVRACLRTARTDGRGCRLTCRDQESLSDVRVCIADCNGTLRAAIKSCRSGLGDCRDACADAAAASGKCPFPGMIPSGEGTSEHRAGEPIAVRWTAAAEARLTNIPEFVRPMAKTGIEKRAIILISDGYDSESKTKFDDVLIELQEENVVLYALQVGDRTRGALLRDKPKPPSALSQLTEGTGGAIFPFNKAKEAASAISDDLRNNWYRLVYTPSGVNTINTRRLLLMSRSKGVELRTKGSHPGRYH